MIEVTLHDAESARTHRAAVQVVYAAVFGMADQSGWQHEVWERHRTRSDFRLATAYDGADLVGFSWGYTGERGQYWSDLVLARLGPAAADWVGGHFEFVELAVLPGVRGLGLGARLHDTLLAGLPHPRAMLSTTADPAAPAVNLYRSRGWERLGAFDADNQVMGKILGAPG